MGVRRISSTPRYPVGKTWPDSVSRNITGWLDVALRIVKFGFIGNVGNYDTGWCLKWPAIKGQ